MKVLTDDSTTLITLVREGVVTKVDLVFSWSNLSWMYKIETNL